GSNVTSRSFAFSPGPKILQSMRVYTSTNSGTLTLSDNLGQTKTQVITIGSMQLVTTGWTQPSTQVTVSFSAGWNLGVDDISYLATGDTVAPSVPTGLSATAISSSQINLSWN